MPTSDIKKLAVVIPMYNEENGVRRCVESVCTTLAKVGKPSHLIVVNDGSHDKTRLRLRELSEIYENLVVVEHATNRGYGQALITGAKEADSLGCDVVLFMDSDLTNDPADIPRFIDKIEEGYDLVKASRYSDGGSVSGVPFKRYIISRMGNLVASRLFNIRLSDCTNGFRAIRINILKDLSFKENAFAQIMEELYYLKSRGVKAVEIPVTLYNRSQSQRPTSFTYRPSVFWKYLKYPIRALLKEYAIMGPDKARIFYDFIAVATGVLVAHTIAAAYGINESFHLLTSISLLSFTLLTVNGVLGIYGRLGRSSILMKVIVIGFGLALTAFIHQLILGGGPVLAVAFAIATPMILLPRIFLNLNTNPGADFLSPIVNENSPVLVIGGAGYLGSSIVNALVKSNKRVRVLDRSEAISRSLRNAYVDQRVEIHEGDFTHSYDLTKALFGVGHVVFAARLGAIEMVDSGRVTMQMLANTTAALGIQRFVFCSCISVYGEQDSRPNEDSELHPADSWSRFLVEGELEFINKLAIPCVTVLRFAHLVGRSPYEQENKLVQSGDDSHFLNELDFEPLIDVDDAGKTAAALFSRSIREVNRETFNVGHEPLKKSEGYSRNVSFEKLGAKPWFTPKPRSETIDAAQKHPEDSARPGASLGSQAIR